MIDSLGASGAEHSTAAMFPLLRDRGHQVSASTLYDAGFGDEERLRAAGFDVRPLTAGSFAGRVRELRRRIRTERPDVVHTALFTADMTGRLAAIGTPARVVSSMVSTPYDAQRLAGAAEPRWKLRAVQLLDLVTGHAAVDRYHAVSEGVAATNRRSLRLAADRVVVAHRGRSADQLGRWSAARRQRVRASLGIGVGQPVVLAAGRQEHAKRHVDLVDAANVLARQFPDVVVLIAGREGNASAALGARLAQLPLAATHVRLLGHRHDVPDLLVAADVLAIPSAYEGTAGVAIEAMALRCPVVCTDVVGVRGVLRSGDNAILVPPRQPAALAAALAKVLSGPQPAGHLADAGERDFAARFTIAASTEAMLEVYRQACA